MYHITYWNTEIGLHNFREKILQISVLDRTPFLTLGLFDCILDKDLSITEELGATFHTVAYDSEMGNVPSYRTQAETNQLTWRY